MIRIELEIDRLLKEFEKWVDEGNHSWEERRAHPNIRIIAALDRKLRLDMPFELTDDLNPLEEDIMLIQDFIEACNSGAFIDYDGYGNYVKDDKRSNVVVKPSDVKYNSIRKDFDKIVWYNK